MRRRCLLFRSLLFFTFSLGFFFHSAKEASATTIQLDFDSLPEGLIVDDEFQLSAGVTIDALKGPASGSQSQGYGVFYDTTQTGGADPDLEGPPWSAGNAQFFIAGNALIVQENGPNSTEISNGILSTNDPDDNGGGGTLIFESDVPLEAIQFWWVDLDTPSDAFLRFIDTDSGNDVSVNFTEFSNPASVFYDPSVVFGDNSFDQINPITVADLTTFQGVTWTQFDILRFELDISGGTAFLEVDTLPDGSIGDFVWNDLDSDGNQDPGEPGIQRVTLDLYQDDGDGVFEPGGDDTLFRSQTTDDQGAYDFIGLPSDDYWVTVSDNFGVLTGAQTNGGAVPDPLLVNLGTDEDFNTADFGYNQPTGSIGDLVWNDDNGNGIFEAGEAGIGQATVRLWRDDDNSGTINSGDTIVRTETTDASGAYDFINLPPDQYIVEVTDDKNVIDGALTTPPEPRVVNLALGEDFNDADFGYNEPDGSIGDLVWRDENQDGIVDPGEPGIGNVTLELFRDENGNNTLDVSDTLIDTAVTDGNGAYDFRGLPAGTYHVDVTDENGVVTSLVFTTANDPETVALAAGEDFNDADFGYFGGGSIGDFVWNDLNGDTVQDPGESGIPNVTVDLYRDVNGDGLFDSGDQYLQTQTTDGSGAYDFTGLGADDYLVVVSDYNGVIDGDGSNRILTTANDPLAVALASGQDFNDADFGYRRRGTIGDFVWNDLNGDGVQDPGEPGIPNATLELVVDVNGNGVIDAGENVALRDTTDANGAYLFENVFPGDFIVRVTDENNVITGALTTGNEPFALTLGGAEDRLDVDFGYNQGNGTIGDFIWSDLDGDGVQDGGEPGIGGVTVDLYRDANGSGTIDSGDPLIGTQVTDAGGNYDFAGLPAGDYLVDVTDANSVIDGGLTTPPDPLLVNLASGQDFNDADFGYQPFGSIGDFVWDDQDGDGNQDAGEPGIQNVTLVLYDDANGNGVIDGGDTQIASTTTDADGRYLFDDLPPGDYIVDVTDDNNVATGLLTTPPEPRAVTLAVGQDFLDADFGYNEPDGEIGDFVWNDLDGDGIQDGGEPGIENVTLELYRDTNGNGSVDSGETLLATTSTDDAGAYLFEGLEPGDYVVVVTDDNTVINGGLTTPPEPRASTLTPGSLQDLTVDFGYDQEDGSISAQVFQDDNCDGLFNGSDAGLGNVTVDLYRDVNGDGVVDAGDVLLDTETTGGGGNYTFDGLAADDYLVEVTDANNVLSGLSLSTVQNPISLELNTGQSFTAADFGYVTTGAPDVVLTFRARLVIDGSTEDGEDGEGRYAFTTGSPGSGTTFVTVQGDSGSSADDDSGWQLYTVNLGPLSADNYELTLGAFMTEHTTVSEDVQAYFDDVTVSRGYVTLLEASFDSGQEGFVYSDDVFGTSNPADANGSYTATEGFSGGGLNVSLGGVTNTALTDISGAFQINVPVPESQGTIGNFVWEDQNRNQLQDDFEPGLGNVTVDLYRDVDGDGVVSSGDFLLGTRTTNSRGFYLFSCLDPDDYVVRVSDTNSVTSGLFLTNTSNPRSLTLGPAEQNIDQDFGYADNPITLVTLSAFEATLAELGGNPRITWKTAREIDAIGYHLYRADLAGNKGVAERLTFSMIPAQGLLSDGAEYQFTDPEPFSQGDSQRGYILRAFETSGSYTDYGPAMLSTPSSVDTGVEEWLDY